MTKTTTKMAMFAIASSLLAAVPAFASSENQLGQGQTVITVLPAKNAAPAAVAKQDLSLKVNGKSTNVTRLQQLQGPNSRVELVVLLDNSARSSLGNQMNDIASFIKGLPPNASVTLGYMQNGRAALTGPFTSDRDKVAKELHITPGVPGINASPYFCLSDLAKNWPSRDADARREVVMVTDGVDYYDLRYDPEDPYVRTAINDAVRAHVIVYSIYWRNTGGLDNRWYETNAGQNLLLQVTEATGGNSYWMGMGDPVSLQPYFADINRRLENQYELSFMAPSNGRVEVANLKLKVANGTKIDAPEQVVVTGSNSAGGEQ